MESNRPVSSMISRCKCPKSDIKANESCSPYLEDITTKMEERRCDLLGRQKYLKDKITTMERSIPALIAYNMWMAKKCDDAPYCKVREIMKKFAPYPDQTEKLLNNLKNTVKELNGETAELHEKIIQADVKLEETDMELESLELANKEMSDNLNNLEKEVQSYKTPSLHSIHSEDLICLSKIRQLAEEELNLKNCIKELEQKETIFKEHMDRLLTSKEYQNVCGRRKINCIQDIECNALKIPCVPKKCILRQTNDHRSKRKQMQQETVSQSNAVVSTSEHNINVKTEQGAKQNKQEEKMEKKSSWISNWWNGNNKKVEDAPSQTNNVTSARNTTNNENHKSVIVSDEQEPDQDKATSDKSPKQLKSKFSTPCKPCGHSPCPPTGSVKLPHCTHPCINPQELQSMLKRSCAGKYACCSKQFMGFPKSSSLRRGCELSFAAVDHGIRSCKPSMMSPCEICPSPCMDFLRSKGNCRCNCRGKCARGLSDAECNCSDVLNDYNPSGTKQLDTHIEDSNSEDEFCECCSCGCEDSDVSLSCQCN